MRKSYRIQRKKEFINQKRMENLKKQQEDYTYDEVFSFQNFINVLPKCLKGVSWKLSVQKYYINALTKLYKDYLAMSKRQLPPPVSSKEIIIRERGKIRTITPIHIKDRVIQKVLCDYAITPILSSKLIYDNGASLAGKGVMFTRNRVLKHLRNAQKEFGNDFYVLQFDFKNFFDSIPHATCRKMLEKYIVDKELVDITMDVIKCHHKKRIKKIVDPQLKAELLRKLDNDELHGMCLGSQVSQIMALIVVNDLDHYIKDVVRCKYYSRYMDDGIIILKSKEELHVLYNDMKKVCANLGLQFNEKKTYIIKISRGFTFLKVRYFINKEGRICRILTHKGIVRMRKKLKKYKTLVGSDKMTLDNVYDSIQSWLAHAKIAMSYHTVRNMLKLYNELFNGYKITKKWRKHYVLQNNK